MERVCGLQAAVVAITGLLSAVGSIGTVSAPAAAETVALADGSTIQLGDQVSLVEQAVDQGWIELAAGDLLERGLRADSAAVLAYGARYRPALASNLAVLAARLAEQSADTYFASLAVAAIAAENPSATGRMEAALNAARLSPSILAASLGSIAVPAAGPASIGAGSQAAEYPSNPSLTDAKAPPESVMPGGAGPEMGFQGSLLPELLRIGGGGSAHGVEPSDDAGAS